jgi:hypothetical protein
VGITEISDTKWDKLLNELGLRLKAEGLPDAEPVFERICLIDDFTASGSNLIRKEESGAWKGKVPTFLEQNVDRIGKHIRADSVVQIHHYMGSHKARETITRLLDEYLKETAKFSFRFNLTFSMVLSQAVVIDEHCPAELVDLLKTCYGKSCQTTHTGQDIWFGYKQCGLPLVLEHNTPNNSIALLWANSRKPNTDNHTMKPLFPRKQRHVDHG